MVNERTRMVISKIGQGREGGREGRTGETYLEKLLVPLILLLHHQPPPPRIIIRQHHRLEHPGDLLQLGLFPMWPTFKQSIDTRRVIAGGQGGLDETEGLPLFVGEAERDGLGTFPHWLRRAERRGLGGVERSGGGRGGGGGGGAGPEGEGWEAACFFDVA